MYPPQISFIRPGTKPEKEMGRGHKFHLQFTNLRSFDLSPNDTYQNKGKPKSKLCEYCF